MGTGQQPAPSPWQTLEEDRINLTQRRKRLRQKDSGMNAKNERCENGNLR